MTRLPVTVQSRVIAVLYCTVLCCRKQYICSYDPGLDCPAGWVSHQGSCYWVSSILASWLTAQTLCKVTNTTVTGT